MAKQDKYSRTVKANRADEREALTGMRQSIGAMIAKIAFGLIFIGVTFDDSGDPLSFGGKVVGLCIGGALLAWGLVPFFAARKKRKAAEEEKAAERAAKILSVPLEKFGDGEAKKAETLAKKYEEKPAAKAAAPEDISSNEPVLGIDWNKDGKLDWKDAAVDKAVIREGKASLFGEEDGPKDA